MARWARSGPAVGVALAIVLGACVSKPERKLLSENPVIDKNDIRGLSGKPVGSGAFRASVFFWSSGLGRPGDELGATPAELAAALAPLSALRWTRNDTVHWMARFATTDAAEDAATAIGALVRLTEGAPRGTGSDPTAAEVEWLAELGLGASVDGTRLAVDRSDGGVSRVARAGEIVFVGGVAPRRRDDDGRPFVNSLEEYLRASAVEVIEFGGMALDVTCEVPKQLEAFRVGARIADYLASIEAGARAPWAGPEITTGEARPRATIRRWQRASQNISPDIRNEIYRSLAGAMIGRYTPPREERLAELVREQAAENAEDLLKKEETDATLVGLLVESVTGAEVSRGVGQRDLRKAIAERVGAADPDDRTGVTGGMVRVSDHQIDVAALTPTSFLEGFPAFVGWLDSQGCDDLRVRYVPR